MLFSVVNAILCFMTSVSSSVGILVYMFVMSKDTNFMSGSYGVSCRSCMTWTEFFMLYMFGSGMYVSRSLVSCLAIL